MRGTRIQGRGKSLRRAFAEKGTDMAREGGSQVWKLVLAYDGTDFHGWQVQPGHATIQGELRKAIERVTGEDTLPQGSGRTDAGVHALAQVASFALSAPIPEQNFARALNRTLPPSIRVESAEHAPADFHARHRARAKTYEYRVFCGRVCSPFLSRYAYALNGRDPGLFNLSAMRHAARHIVGEHDFSSFAANDPERRSHEAECVHQEQLPENHPEGNMRTIFSSEWLVSPASENPCASTPVEISGEQGGKFENQVASFAQAESLENRGERFEDELKKEAGAKSFMLLYRVRGNGFLHHMVRNLVGTFLEVGRGNLEEGDLRRILEARSRESAGPTAPARGLFLIGVEY